MSVESCEISAMSNRQGEQIAAGDLAGAEPLVCAVVVHVGRIDQRDQQIHVQQEPSRGNSSSSRRTSSELTSALPG